MGYGGKASVLSHCHAFGANDSDIRQPNETEHAFEIALLVFEKGSLASLLIGAASCRGDEHLLSLRQKALRHSALAVPKGLSGNHDTVNPCLQLRRDGEVVHRCPDDNDIGSEQLVDIGSALGKILAQHLVLDSGALPRCHMST